MAIQDLFNQVNEIKGFRADVPDYYEYLKSGYEGGMLGEADVSGALSTLLEQSRLSGFGQPQQAPAQTQTTGVPQNELDTLRGYYSNQAIYDYNPTYVEDLYSGFQSGKYGYNDALNAFKTLERQASPNAAPTPSQAAGTSSQPAWQTNPAQMPFAYAGAMYLAQNKDVKDAGLDPYEHYTKYGKAEGRKWPGLETQPTQAVYTDYGPDKYGVGADIIGQVTSSDGKVLRTYFSDNTYSDQSWDPSNKGIIGQQRMQDGSGDWFTRVITNEGKVQDIKDKRGGLSKFFSSSGLGGILSGVPISNAIGDLFGDKTFAKQVVPSLFNPVGVANQQIAQTWDKGGKPLDVFSSTLETLADPTNSVNYSLAKGGDLIGEEGRKWITPVLTAAGTIIYPVAGTALGAGIGQHLAGGTQGMQVTPQGTYMSSPQASNAAVKGAGTSAGTAFAAGAISPYIQSGLNTSPVTANALSTGVASTAMNKAAYNQDWNEAIKNGLIAGTLNYVGGKLAGYFTDANGNRIDASTIKDYDFDNPVAKAIRDAQYRGDYTGNPADYYAAAYSGQNTFVDPSDVFIENPDLVYPSHTPMGPSSYTDFLKSYYAPNDPGFVDYLKGMEWPYKSTFTGGEGFYSDPSLWMPDPQGDVFQENPLYSLYDSSIGTNTNPLSPQDWYSGGLFSGYNPYSGFPVFYNDITLDPTYWASNFGSAHDDFWKGKYQYTDVSTPWYQSLLGSVTNILPTLLANPALLAPIASILTGGGNKPSPTPPPGDVIFPGGVDNSGSGTGSSAFFTDQGGIPGGSAGLEAALARLSKILSSGPIYGGIKGYKGEQYYT